MQTMTKKESFKFKRATYGNSIVQWNLDLTKGKGTDKICSLYEVSLNQGYFPYILLLLGLKAQLAIQRTLLYRGLLYRGSTVRTSVSLHLSLSRNLPYPKNQEVVCEFQ